MSTVEKRTARLAAARTSRIVRDELMALILERGLAPGELLPTEFELVEDLGVSRNSVREALKALQALDIVEIRHGHGTYVGGLSLNPLADGLAFRTLQRIGRDARAVSELLETREALEDGLIRRVAASIPDADIDALETVTAAMEAKAGRNEDFAEEDRQFHELLYRSLDNQIVVQLLRAFWDVFHRVNDRLGGEDPDLPETARRHRAILAALRSRDVDGAQRAMTEHFRNIDARVALLEATHLGSAPA
jgi:DNA-binding FadR family transcriptional regulator